MVKMFLRGASLGPSPILHKCVSRVGLHQIGHVWQFLGWIFSWMQFSWVSWACHFHLSSSVFARLSISYIRVFSVGILNFTKWAFKICHFWPLVKSPHVFSRRWIFLNWRMRRMEVSESSIGFQMCRFGPFINFQGVFFTRSTLSY